MPDRGLLRKFLAAACAVSIAAAPVRAAEQEKAEKEVEEFMDMSLETLLRLDVTSVTGAAVPWFRNPAAVYTVSSEDIRRTGHQSLAEVLRMVPGMHVARLDSRQWAVTARGFNNQFAKNLLVLTDSRLVYDPSFSGVFWDVQDLILEDVDRIEVIRGPGATLWGANAVNGVINVTTRSSKDTQGLYLTLGGGTEERGFGAVRYGGKLGGRSYFRVWGKYLNRDGSSQVGTGAQPDRWDLPHGGVRFDLQPSASSRLMLSADGYHTKRLGESTRVPVMELPTAPNVLPGREVAGDGEASGAHLIARYERDTSGGGFTAQTYYERQHRRVFAGIQLDRDVADLDLRYRHKAGARHELMAGLAWHYVDDRTERGQLIGTVPPGRTFSTFSGFLQDTIALRPERLSLMVGSKFEHNDFTGVEYQPSARVAFTPGDRHTFWAALSRPVRTPARADLDVDLVYGYIDPGLLAAGRPSGRFLPVKILGNEHLVSERLVAYETGYRVQLGGAFAVDVAGFANRYQDLITFPRTPALSPVDLRLQAANAGGGEGYGGEVVLNWRPSSRWRTTGSYAYMVAKADSEAPPSFARHSGHVRSHVSVTRQLELNAAAYYTGEGAPPSADEKSFEPHLRADLGLTFRPSSHLEIAVWGQDLLKERHVEYDSPFIQFARSELERGVYAQVTLRK